MIEKTIRIINKTGLHARPAAQFVDRARKFKSKITVVKNGSMTDAKSILGVLSLGIGQGADIRIIIAGEDEQQAVDDLVKLLNSLED
ncbi:MAG: HPr family phosphocarrier protein [Thermacetogeniaceae bacterium]|jgi:phosphocarrier protein